MIRGFVLVVVLAGLLGAGVLSAEEAPEGEKKLDAEGVLARIDGALFLPDAQEGLESYSCKLSVTKATKSDDGGKMVPDKSKIEFLANLVVNAKKGTREWTDKRKKPVPAGAWAPFCGPWTLTNVMQLETELFLSPLSPRFPEKEWKREVEETDAGWRLTLTPKSSSVNAVATDFLTPAVKSVELAVGRDGVPTGATLDLQQGPMEEEGEVTFEFADVDGKKRIAAIKSTLKSANLTIHPVLTFTYDEQKGFPLPDQVLFHVPPGDLSPSLGGMGGPPGMGGAGGFLDTVLLFGDYKVKGRKKK